MHAYDNSIDNDLADMLYSMLNIVSLKLATVAATDQLYQIANLSHGNENLDTLTQAGQDFIDCIAYETAAEEFCKNNANTINLESRSRLNTLFRTIARYSTSAVEYRNDCTTSEKFITLINQADAISLEKIHSILSAHYKEVQTPRHYNE